MPKTLMKIGWVRFSVIKIVLGSEELSLTSLLYFKPFLYAVVLVNPDISLMWIFIMEIFKLVFSYLYSFSCPKLTLSSNARPYLNILTFFVLENYTAAKAIWLTFLETNSIITKALFSTLLIFLYYFWSIWTEYICFDPICEDPIGSNLITLFWNYSWLLFLHIYSSKLLGLQR